MQQMENLHGPMTISNVILIRQPLGVLTIGSFGTRTVTQIESSKYSRPYLRYMIRGGNAEKRTFDWVIAPLKDGCVFVEWVLGFNLKYFKFHFGH